MSRLGAALVLVGVLLLEAAEAENNELRQDECPHCLDDMLDFMEGTFQILPGLNISASRRARPANSTSFVQTLESFLRGVTLHVAVYNEPVLRVLEGPPDSSSISESGRAKKKKKRFQFLSVYTVFALGFALMSALVGKALTLSIVSLVCTLLVGRAVRADLANNSPPAFDVIRRPQVQLQHTHSAEDVYEIPTGGGPGNTVSYVYSSSPLRGRTVMPGDSYPAFGPSAVHVTSVKSTSSSSSDGVRPEHAVE